MTSAVLIEMRGDEYYLEYGTMRIRWDALNMWMITMDEETRTAGSRNVRGLCGNFDGDPLSKLILFTARY